MDEDLETSSEDQAAQLAAIDQATLTPLVQSALSSKTVEVVNWAFEQLYGMPMGVAFDSVARMRHPLFRKLDQARQLMDLDH